MMERDHVAEEALLRIINIARQHIGVGGRLPPRTGSRPSSCTRTQARPPDTVNFA
jgi:hypothetical protein